MRLGFQLEIEEKDGGSVEECGMSRGLSTSMSERQ